MSASGSGFIQKVSTFADNPLVRSAVWVIVFLCVFILKGWHAEAMDSIKKIQDASVQQGAEFRATHSVQAVKIETQTERIIRLEENYKKLDENIHRIDDSIKTISRQIERVADKVGAKKE